MKKTTKRSIILGCVFVLLSAINLVMEYRKNNPANLTFKWIMLVFFIIFALVSFIRYKKTVAEKVDKDEKKSA
jgi:uncharacterized membrane protein